MFSCFLRAHVFLAGVRFFVLASKSAGTVAAEEAAAEAAEKEATDEDPREHLNLVFIGHGQCTWLTASWVVGVVSAESQARQHHTCATLRALKW